MKDDEALARAIAGALRSAIHDHGPITLEGIGSAVKRVLGALANIRPAQSPAPGRAAERKARS